MEFVQSKNEFSAESFERLNVVDADLSGKYFYDCHFAHCNFSEAKLVDCLFDGCSFTECNLSNAVVKRSAFREVGFKSCKLVGIDWPSAKWPSVALSGLIEFDECLLNGSSFFGLTPQELKMEACQVHEVDFTETDCADASFIQSDFGSSTFHQTNLTGADFTDATNYQIDVFTNRIDGATFSLPDAVNLLRGLPIKVID